MAKMKKVQESESVQGYIERFRAALSEAPFDFATALWVLGSVMKDIAERRLSPAEANAITRECERLLKGFSRRLRAGPPHSDEGRTGL